MSRTARFFQTCDPHETLRMAVKIDVLTFCVFAVFVEKTTKNESKISTLATSPKNLQKVPGFGTQNGPELTLRCQKASQKRKKRNFWPLRERSQKKVKKKPLSLKVPQLAGVEPILKIYVSV